MKQIKQIVAISGLISVHKMHLIRFRPGLRPGPRWGAHDVPQTPSRLGRGHPSPFPSPSAPTAPRFSPLRRSSRRLRRLASSVPQFTV